MLQRNIPQGYVCCLHQLVFKYLVHKTYKVTFEVLFAGVPENTRLERLKEETKYFKKLVS